MGSESEIDRSLSRLVALLSGPLAAEIAALEDGVADEGVLVGSTPVAVVGARVLYLNAIKETLRSAEGVVGRAAGTLLTNGYAQLDRRCDLTAMNPHTSWGSDLEESMRPFPVVVGLLRALVENK